ncbi:MAG: hypothetical protein AABO58_02060 [Acidobacteriota bacterium]
MPGASTPTFAVATVGGTSMQEKPGLRLEVRVIVDPDIAKWPTGTHSPEENCTRTNVCESTAGGKIINALKDVRLVMKDGSVFKLSGSARATAGSLA